ncbi:DNA-primase RepB domain-containing protein [Novosphingobium resinovorum]
MELGTRDLVQDIEYSTSQPQISASSIVTPPAARIDAPSTMAVTSGEFLKELFSELPEGATVIVTGKSGDPQAGAWFARPASEVDLVCPPHYNTYFNCASVYPTGDSAVLAQKEVAAAFHVLVLDDVGTKVDRALLRDVDPTWVIETSPGNFQVGFKLSTPLQSSTDVDALLSRVAAAGLTDNGAKGMVRWMRLPNGINGKDKYRQNGRPFQCRLVVWNPTVAYTGEGLVEALALPAAPVKTRSSLSGWPRNIMACPTSTGTSINQLSRRTPWFPL